MPEGGADKTLCQPWCDLADTIYEKVFALPESPVHGQSVCSREAHYGSDTATKWTERRERGYYNTTDHNNRRDTKLNVCTSHPLHVLETNADTRIKYRYIFLVLLRVVYLFVRSSKNGCNFTCYWRRTKNACATKLNRWNESNAISFSSLQSFIQKHETTCCLHHPNTDKTSSIRPTITVSQEFDYLLTLSCLKTLTTISGKQRHFNGKKSCRPKSLAYHNSWQKPRPMVFSYSGWLSEKEEEAATAGVKEKAREPNALFLRECV